MLVQKESCNEMKVIIIIIITTVKRIKIKTKL